MAELHSHDQSPKPTAIEIDPEKLEVILQPNELLAAQSLERSIELAEADPKTDPDALALLRFQRSMVDMSPGDAKIAAGHFAETVGKYATYANQGDGRLPDLHYPVNRGLVVRNLADEERWRVLGINPREQYGEDPYGQAYQEGIETSWAEARTARAASAAAQAAEAEAMELVARPPAFEPRSAV